MGAGIGLPVIAVIPVYLAFPPVVWVVVGVAALIAVVVARRRAKAARHRALLRRLARAAEVSDGSKK